MIELPCTRLVPEGPRTLASGQRSAATGMVTRAIFRPGGGGGFPNRLPYKFRPPSQRIPVSSVCRGGRTATLRPGARRFSPPQRRHHFIHPN